MNTDPHSIKWTGHSSGRPLDTKVSTIYSKLYYGKTASCTCRCPFSICRGPISRKMTCVIWEREGLLRVSGCRLTGALPPVLFQPQQPGKVGFYLTEAGSVRVSEDSWIKFYFGCLFSYLTVNKKNRLTRNFGKRERVNICSQFKLTQTNIRYQKNWLNFKLTSSD